MADRTELAAEVAGLPEANATAGRATSSVNVGRAASSIDLRGNGTGEGTDAGSRADLEVLPELPPEVVAGKPEPDAAPRQRSLTRGRTAAVIAGAFVLLAVAAMVFTKYPDLRGETSIASKVLGFESTDLPLVLRGKEIVSTRVSLPGTIPLTYSFALAVHKTPWTIETDASSPYTEIHFDQVDALNFAGVRQVPQFGGWEVFKRTNGADSRLGWIAAGAHDDRPLVIVRTKDKLTVMLGTETAANTSLSLPVKPTTVGLVSMQSTPEFTYFDVREAK